MKPEKGKMKKSIGRLAPAVALTVLFFAGCSALAERAIEKRTPASAGEQWRPKKGETTRTDTSLTMAQLPRELLERQWSLEDIVDIALRNNPATRASWQAARSAAARHASEQGAWLPRIDGTAEFNRASGAVAGGRLNYQSISYEAGFTLNYILFNFGKRRAVIESARQEMLAYNWSHNAAVQNVTLLVQEAYYRYLYVKATRLARQAALEEAGRGLDAAETRRGAGLATVADVLQARTHVSQAELALQSVEGEIQTIRGSLATAMGLPADIEYDIDVLPEDIPVDSVTVTVDRYIEQARAMRPDLAAFRARALQAGADLVSVRAERYPSFSLRGGASRIYYNSRDRSGDLYNFGFMMSVPLFTGFSHTNDVLAARADAEEAKEQYRRMEQQVMLDVWTSYYELKTAGKRLQTSRDLLRSATESHQVAEERYRAGVGGILELLQTQAALEDARAQNIAARTDWLLFLARLAHDTGALGLTEIKLSPEE